MSPQEFLQKLENNEIYINWVKNNTGSFLTHFFVQIDKNLDFLTNWEVGFYDSKTSKITVFTSDFSIKPADDVFKKNDSQIEKLELKNVKLNLNQASLIFKENLIKYFPNEQIGNGFLVLQQLQGKTLWNFTLITKTIKFINQKINANNGELVAHETIELIDKNK